MNPYLDPQNNPHLKIEVLLSSWKTVDCLIDTGFSGGIALPENFLVGFKEKALVYQEYELANGSFTTVERSPFSLLKVMKDYWELSF